MFATYPSIISWCARHTHLRPLRWLNSCVMSSPHVYLRREKENEKRSTHTHKKEVNLSTTAAAAHAHTHSTHPAPRGEGRHPVMPMFGSGSDQRRSQIGPSFGTSPARSSSRTSSMDESDGERPPCKQK